MDNSLLFKLYTLYKEMINCDLCSKLHNIKVGRPQLRPIGDNYHNSRILFLQINPGNLGSLTDEEIKEYSEPKRKIIYKIKEGEKVLRQLSEKFMENNSFEIFIELHKEYINVLKTLSGHVKGKLNQVITNHGVTLDDVALLNLAHCPTTNNKYPKGLLKNCYNNWTKKIIDLLQPKVIVAQGKETFIFISELLNFGNIKIIEGVHHASRQSNEWKNEKYNEVKNFLKTI